MRGDLSQTSAADACRELARQGSTGLLAIEGPEGPGSVSMVEGRIVAAASPTPRARLGDRLVGASYLDEQDLAEALRLQRSDEGHARLGVLLVERGLVSRDAVRLFIQEQMLDALFDVLFWRYGTFEFIHGEATEVLEVPLSIAVDEILVEIARRQQEWEQVRQVIPDLEAVPTFRAGASSASAALEPDEFAILASVDGERSVRALASDLGYGEFEAARIVYGLCLLGIVEITLPEDEVGAAFDDAFSTGTPQGEPIQRTDDRVGDRTDDRADEHADAGAADAGNGAAAEPTSPEPTSPEPTSLEPSSLEPTSLEPAEAAARLDTELSDLIAELTGARERANDDRTRDGTEPSADASDITETDGVVGDPAGVADGGAPGDADGDAVGDATGSEDDEPEPFSPLIDDPEAAVASWPRGDTWPPADREPDEPPEPKSTWAIDEPTSDPVGDAAAWAPTDEPAEQPPREASTSAPTDEPAEEPPRDASAWAPTDEEEPEAPQDGPEHWAAPPPAPDSASWTMDEPTDAPSDEPVHDTAELDPLRAEPTPERTTPPDVPPQPPTSPAPGARQGGPDLAPWVDDPDGAGVAEPPARDLPVDEPEPYQRTIDEPEPSDRPVDGTPPPERPTETPPTQDRPVVEAPPSDEQPTHAPPPQDGAIDDAPPWVLEADEPADDREPEATDDVDQVDDDDTPASSSDVSEFLRELSRLALDGDEAQKPRPGATPPRRAQREDDKPKKRGIFGWGS